ncbi:hypothetical protein MMC29_007642 [Sticta canariensis]|nr:hypothetical protein [Sticta canariensis]
MLEQLLQLQFVLPVCVGLSLTGILALVFTFQNGGNFFSIWRKKGYSQVNTDPDDHRHHQTYLDRTLATLGSAASATLRLVRTSCSNLAAIYSDSVISSLYPARLFIQNGESVPESQVESAQFNWLSPKAWYLATSRCPRLAGPGQSVLYKTLQRPQRLTLPLVRTVSSQIHTFAFSKSTQLSAPLSTAPLLPALATAKQHPASYVKPIDDHDSGSCCRLSSTWKLVRGSGKPEIFCQPGGFADLLQQQCPSLHQPYAPPFWARNRHVHLISSVSEMPILR